MNQNPYFAGDTNSTSLFPLDKAYQSSNNGGYDAFVTQLGSALSMSITGILSQGTNQNEYIDAGSQATFTYTVTNNGPDLANSVTITDALNSTSVPLTFISASANSVTCGGGSTSTSVSCPLSPLQAGSTATVTIVVTPTPKPDGSQAEFNGGTVQAVQQGNIVLAQTSVSAKMSDFSMQVTPPSGSVLQAGDSASYAVQLTPNPVYSHAISLACSGLPTGATCNFSQPSVTLLGPGSSTLTITTTARPVVTPAASLWTRHFYAVWLGLPGLTLLGVGVSGATAPPSPARHSDVLCPLRPASAAAGVQQCDLIPARQRNPSRQLHHYRYRNCRRRCQKPDRHAGRSVELLFARQNEKEKAHGANLRGLLILSNQITRCHPERSRSSGEAKDLPLNRYRAPANQPGAPFLARPLREKWGFSTDKSKGSPAQPRSRASHCSCRARTARYAPADSLCALFASAIPYCRILYSRAL